MVIQHVATEKKVCLALACNRLDTNISALANCQIHEIGWQRYDLSARHFNLNLPERLQAQIMDELSGNQRAIRGRIDKCRE